MATAHLLGTGGAVTDRHRNVTMLAFTDARSTILVDCGGDVVHRMLSAGIDPDTIVALIVTHEHPDHVAGFPLFMEKIWLHGRRRAIPVYGIRQALTQARKCWEVFDTASWEGVPPIDWKEIPYEEGAQVLANHTWKVSASPGKHAVPVVGLRVESRVSGRCVVYSCDTEPCESIVRLAKGADILFHEANGEGAFHSSAEQAAQVAADAAARDLVLVHLPNGMNESRIKQAVATFPETKLGVELGGYPF